MNSTLASNAPLNFTFAALILSFFVGASARALPAPASGTAKIAKIFDGGAAVCPKDYVEYGPREKVTEYQLDGTDIIISMKICDRGQATLDPALETETFQTPSGVTARITHSGFKLVVQGPNGSDFKVLAIADFNKDFIKDRWVRIPLAEIFKDVGRAGSTTVDLSVHADRSTELSTGAKFLDAVNWTQIRVTK